MVNMVIGSESGYRSGDKTPIVVKMEIEDSLQEEHAPLNKRPRQSMGMGGSIVLQPEYNPLDEPSPLGLRLRKSPSLLELIQMKLSEANAAKVGSHSHVKKELKGIAAPGDKLKASNFPGSFLRIGSWEYKSRYEGDLVAKCYFAKHKLVWEVLDGGLKNKIEIQWSDIMALKANYPDDEPGTLDVVLARLPLFFRETNPQPRKHTLWQTTSDFTGGEASVHRRHYLECPPGLLGKHFEKLVQCDPRLNFLSQQGEITLDSPYFEPKVQAFDDQTCSNNDLDLNREGSPTLFSLLDNASPFAAQSSSSRNDVETLVRSTEFFTHETPSPSSAQHTSTVEDIKGFEFERLKETSNWDQIMVPGLSSSMSMSDLVNHLEHRMSEQGNSSNPRLSSEDWESLQMLDEINRCLFSDFNNIPESDDKSLMTRVNSLCCLLQTDTASCSNPPVDSGTPRRINSNKNKEADPDQSSMPRTDSVGDLLLNLPRIASLPHFLFNVSENFESQAR